MHPHRIFSRYSPSIGDVNYVDRNTAIASNLSYINDAGNVVLKVDDSSFVHDGQKRDSVRINSMDSFGFGTLWVLDAYHTPYGCRYVVQGGNNSARGSNRLTLCPVSGVHTGVLEQVFHGHMVNSIGPTVRSMLKSIPGGEIDIFEGVNMQNTNQMTLHTGPDCSLPSGLTQTGVPLGRDCTYYPGNNAGCGVTDPNTNSYGKEFAGAGGGIWITQFETSGIKIWFVPVSDCLMKPSFYR